MEEGYKIQNEFTESCMKKVQKCIPGNSSNLDVINCYIDQYDTTVVLISGGLNGNGCWSGYLSDLTKLLRILEDEFEDAWVIEIDNDCLDDVFYTYLGVREYSSDKVDEPDRSDSDFESDATIEE